MDARSHEPIQPGFDVMDVDAGPLLYSGTRVNNRLTEEL